MSNNQDNWQSGLIGSFIREKKERLGNGFAIPYSVSKVLGIVPQREKFKKRIASSNISKYKVIKKGDFAYDPMLLWDGSINRMNRNEIGVVSPVYVTFQISSKLLDSDYFLYFLKSETTKNFYKNISKGTNVRRQKAEFRDFAKGQFLIPPLIEQKKISEILNCIDEFIANIQKQVDKLQFLKKATMRELLTKGIGHTDFKNSDLGRIPNSWQLKKFKDVCSVVNGQVNPNEEPYSSMKNIGPGNIEKFTGRLLNVQTASEDGQTSGKYLFNKSNVLYGKINPQFAKVAFPRYSGVCSADMYPINCRDDLKPIFLFHYLLSDEFTNYAISVSGRTGMPKINRDDLNLAKIKIPPIAEQIKISSILNSLDNKIRSTRKRIEKLLSIKRSITQDLLTGKVRVPVK